jgi:hypothetical protein
MQLEAYLDSLMHFGGIKPEAINVIVSEGSRISYGLTRARFPRVCWIAESDFQQDLLRILENSENYILFGCDDVVFHNYFDINDCILSLKRDPEIFGFSLRLGTDINFIANLRENDDALTWSWGTARADYWNYPWEVSAAVYRRQAVLTLLRGRSDLSNPNRLEAYIAKEIANGQIVVPPKLACFPTSCCATITVNRVQDEFPNDFDTTKPTGPQDLYEDYSKGTRQDWPRLALQKNGSVHLGAESFHTTHTLQPPDKCYVLLTGSDSVQKRKRWLTVRFWWWTFMATGWEFIRKVLPRPILNALKGIVRQVRPKNL